MNRAIRDLKSERFSPAKTDIEGNFVIIAGTTMEFDRIQLGCLHSVEFSEDK